VAISSHTGEYALATRLPRRYAPRNDNLYKKALLKYFQQGFLCRITLVTLPAYLLLRRLQFS
jgi:hypothetical protein